MGSFNTTCFASMQTIASYDECYIIPIAQSSSYRPVEISRKDKEYSVFSFTNSTCYTHAFWKPCGRMIRANYDDYGRFIIPVAIDNLRNLESFLQSVKGKLFASKEGENSSHDVPFDPSDIDVYFPIKSFDTLWSAVEEHRVFVSDYQGTPRPLAFAVVSAPAVRNLIEYTSKLKNWEGESNKIEDRIARLKKRFDEEILPLKDTRMFYIHIRMLIEEPFNMGEYCRMNVGEDIHDISKEIEENGFTDKVVELLKPMFNETHFYTGLNELNIKITPQFYASQDYDNSVGRAYTKFVSKTSKEISKNRKSLYEDDE
jgi:hypothetical protein